MASNNTRQKHEQHGSGCQSYSRREATGRANYVKQWVQVKFTWLRNHFFKPSYPVFGENVVSKVSFSPLAICDTQQKTFDIKEINVVLSFSEGRNLFLLNNRFRKCLNIALTWSSTVISVPKVLSVFHFSVKVRPYSDLLYLVSRLPATLLVSVLEEPDVLNSCKGQF